jgi:hypothetical protein
MSAHPSAAVFGRAGPTAFLSHPMPAQALV